MGIETIRIDQVFVTYT